MLTVADSCVYGHWLMFICTGSAQMDWLRLQLKAAVSAGERCIVFCHMPLDPTASQEQNMPWNREELCECIHTHGSTECSGNTVIAVIGGHDHGGGYCFDSAHGIHHIVPSSPIECDQGQVSYGVIRVLREPADPDPGAVSSAGGRTYIQVDWTGKLPRQHKMWPDRLYIS